MTISFDTEGTGLVSPLVTVQYAVNRGPVKIHEIWKTPCRTTLKLLDRLATHKQGVRGFNLTHDWFHVQRTHNVLSLLDPDQPPTIAGWCAVEAAAVNGPCVKPVTACDVFLHARKGPWQSLMNRDNIRIRNVPVALAQPLAEHLTKSIFLEPIYFSKREDGYEWKVAVDEDNPDFPDVVLRFGASMGLKPLARHVTGEDCPDFPVEDSRMPEETLWDPLGSRDWTRVMPYHIGFWHTNLRARKYAADDVRLTDIVWESIGSPPAGDVDSILACQVASARWHGYATDQKAVSQLLESSTILMDAAPRAPQPVLFGLRERCSPIEAIAIENTQSVTLERIGGQYNNKTQIWTGGWGEHKAVPFARSVMRARSAEKDRDGARKMQNRRLHPDMKIIGTLSGRMAGGGGFNVTGLSDALKECLTLADGDMPILDGGDAWSFEVCIAAAVYGDVNLTRDLRKHKLHALFAADVLEMDYEEIYDDEHDKPVNKPIYQQGKVATLARLYGAQDPKLASIFGVPVGKVRAGSKRLEERYPGIGKSRARIAADFSWMRQLEDRGKIEWGDGKDHIDSMFGYSRSFKLEKAICKELFELGQNPPEELKSVTGICQRRSGRVQTLGGAAQTAIFACAFHLQSAAARAASNHEIQAAGAKITKEVQVEVWNLQPSGVHPWVVQPLNEHDSVMVPHIPGLEKSLEMAVANTVECFREHVPLLRIDWKTGIPNWKAK